MNLSENTNKIKIKYMENKTNLYKAILNVMKSVKNIDKSMTVGTGHNSYKGVADKDVKQIIGKAMEENGLAILPIGIESKVSIDRWEESTQFGNKTKQSAFTEVTTKYLLIHESGESEEIVGYGHGVDTQDKGAGKATTYALKYALLYTFMVPTGKIDDADNEHSDIKEIPQAPKLTLLTTELRDWNRIKARVEKGETITRKDLMKYYDISKVEKELETLNIF